MEPLNLNLDRLQPRQADILALLQNTNLPEIQKRYAIRDILKATYQDIPFRLDNGWLTFKATTPAVPAQDGKPFQKAKVGKTGKMKYFTRGQESLTILYQIVNGNVLDMWIPMLCRYCPCQVRNLDWHLMHQCKSTEAKAMQKAHSDAKAAALAAAQSQPKIQVELEPQATKRMRQATGSSSPKSTLSTSSSSSSTATSTMSVWLDHNRLRELQGTLEEKGFHTVNDLLSILSMGIADVAQMLNGDYPKSIKLIGALKLVKQ